jgi:SOS-response transcriptional repressor LexA
MSGLTERQAEILRFMIQFIVKYHTHATTNDIMEEFKMNSRSAANAHIQALIKKGYLEYVIKGPDSERGSWKVVREPEGKRIQFGVYVQADVK